MSSRLKFQLFPRSVAVTPDIQQVIDCFKKNFDRIDSSRFTYASDEVLSFLREDLANIDYKVEIGKKDDEKIKVPVLFGENNSVDKSFNADALSKDGRIVVEVEAGRAVVNNQFLKDIFQASLMFGVEYLVLAVRNDYKGSDNFSSIYTFLETVYISNRVVLPLKGILVIGY